MTSDLTSDFRHLDGSSSPPWPSYRIRSARRHDAKDLAHLLTSSFHTDLSGLARWMYPLLQLGIYEDLRGRLRSHKPRYSCLVAIQPASTCDRASHTNHSHTSDTIVGTVEIAYKSAYPWQTQHYAGPYIANLAVHQHYRRRGIALKLLQVCEQTAKDWGFNQLYLHVLETNAPARRLYRKAGYEEQAKESGLSSWLLGQPQRLLLRKTLSI